MTAGELSTFVERVRARRVATGRPEQLDDEALYRILDGILERGTTPAGSQGRPITNSGRSNIAENADA